MRSYGSVEDVLYGRAAALSGSLEVISSNTTDPILAPPPAFRVVIPGTGDTELIHLQFIGVQPALHGVPLSFMRFRSFRSLFSL